MYNKIYHKYSEYLYIFLTNSYFSSKNLNKKIFKDYAKKVFIRIFVEVLD